MVRGMVEGTEEAGFVDDLIPQVAHEFASGALVSKEAVERELDVMLAEIRNWWSYEPDQVLISASAISARCTELAVHLHRLEGDRKWRQVRTLQVDKILAEVDRQTRMHSRIVELRRQDLQMLR